VSAGASTASRPASRLDRARAILAELEVDALLVSRPAGRRWLSGFVLRPGEETTSEYSGTLLVTPDAQVVLVDGRYLEQAGVDCPGWTVRLTTDPIGEELPRLAAELGLGRLAAESSVLTHADWSAISAAGLELVAADDQLRDLRLSKDAQEISAIQRACALTDACLAHLLESIRVGQTERQVAWELEGWFRDNGAEALAFEPLVLVGARAALPHGHAGDTRVAVGEPLLIDFGCQVDGYRSDMTRTLFFGEPAAETRHRYEAVRQAQRLAFEAAAPGVIGSELDQLAREHLAQAGLGDAFVHGLGHGIGLETHEAPILKRWDSPLRAGMVFTLEPGVYFPGEIGIRLEDVVHLTDAGPIRLTHAPQELQVL
jgi:Xaa-Pro aminopeptidase